MTDPRDTMRWVWRGSALAALLIGWVFIAWQNRFHISAPLVFVCLGYLAVVATVFNLWRTGAAAVASADSEADSTWAKPAGAVGELEREKRTLLKAIKEAEFDHEMGKLSQHDADAMIRTYRGRAIEVIKELDRLTGGGGAVGTPREQIMREVRARLELEARSHKKPGAVAAAGGKADPSAKAARSKTKPAPAAASAELAVGTEPAASQAVIASAAEPAVGDAVEPVVSAAQRKAEASQARASAVAKAADQAVIDDEALNADSTTSVEPRRDPAKEATP